MPRLLADRVVTGFRAEADSSVPGYSITAMIFVNVGPGDWPSVREQPVHLPGFEYLAVTSGGFDFVVIVRVHDVASQCHVVLERLHRIKALGSTQTVFVLDEDRRLPAAAELRPGAGRG
jgi:Lrp/AsnC family transcriptional regulator, leucine-responsive regulatory protein